MISPSTGPGWRGSVREVERNRTIIHRGNIGGFLAVSCKQRLLVADTMDVWQVCRFCLFAAAARASKAEKEEEDSRVCITGVSFPLGKHGIMDGMGWDQDRSKTVSQRQFKAY